MTIFSCRILAGTVRLHTYYCVLIVYVVTVVLSPRIIGTSDKKAFSGVAAIGAVVVGACRLSDTHTRLMVEYIRVGTLFCCVDEAWAGL